MGTSIPREEVEDIIDWQTIRNDPIVSCRGSTTWTSGATPSGDQTNKPRKFRGIKSELVNNSREIDLLHAHT